MRGAFDAVVVGAGAAGCVMARRLADAGADVALVEAGPAAPFPRSITGLDTVSAADEPRHRWIDLRDEADRPYRQGRGVGGGTLINSLVLSPGHPADYDRWASEHDCDGWAAADMVPWLRRAMAAYPTVDADPGPLGMAVERAALEAGHPAGGSTLDTGRLGVLRAALAAADEHRVSAADAHLSGAPPELTVMAGTAADRLLVARRSGRPRVDGVSLADGRRVIAPTVVLAAGALRTPALLMRSGLVNPSVGTPLKDHPSFAFTVRLRREAVAPRTVSRLVRWSSGADEVGDAEAMVIDRIGGAGERLAVVVVGLMRVTSVGRITHPDKRLRFRTGSLSELDDRRRFRRAIRHAATWLMSAPVGAVAEQVLVDDRGTPIERLSAMGDDDLDRWLADHPGPYAHVASSCPMGGTGAGGLTIGHEPGAMGLVSTCDGLRLADASVLPDLVVGGLQIPITAVAERLAADIVAAAR